MKGTVNIIVVPIKGNTGGDEIDKMILGKELSEWVQRTSKILVNMRQLYIIIVGQRTIFTRWKLDSLKCWEKMS